MAGKVATLLALSTMLYSVPALADDAAAGGGADLQQAFRDPPASARPRVWWHWMNGNITKDGIAKDLAWMKRVGIGGAQAFDANYQTPQIVPRRLTYMTPEWKQAFRFAAAEADRLGLELGVASSPGFSETGGPWVPPADGLKKLVWSETDIAGGHVFAGRLPAPPAVTGPFQSLPMDSGGGSMLGGHVEVPVAPPTYADIAVLAVPVADAALPGKVTVTDGAGTALDASALSDADLTTGVAIARPSGEAPALLLTYAKPQRVQSATLYAEGVKGGVGPALTQALEADDGTGWKPVVEIPAGSVPTTVSFAPVTASRFRVVFNRGKGAGMLGFAPPTPGLDMAGLGKLLATSTRPPQLKVMDFRLFADSRVDRFEVKAGFAMTADFSALSKGLAEAGGADPARVIDLTDRLGPDGTLRWSPPGGRWRVLRLGYSLIGTTNHPASAEATGLEVDKFDGAAVRRYAEHYFGMFRDTVGPDLIGKRGLQAVVNDSIEIGAANWTPRLVDQFRRLRGYDPRPWLPVLTGTLIGSRAQSDRFLFDFRQTLSDLMATEHYGAFTQVAHENGLKVYSEALEDHRPSLGDDMAMRQFADVPMGALWTYGRGQGPKPTYLADLKGAASVAHIYGQNLVGAESLTSLMAPWAYGPGDLKRVIDLAFAMGVNLPSIHTSVHVPVDDKFPGLSLFFFGQYFNRGEAWAELARPWMDYVARNSLMLQQGRNQADVAYYYGEEAPLTALFGDKPVADVARDRAFDFVSADALLNRLSVDNGELVTPAGARYRLLWLGDSARRMSLPVLRKLAALAEAGARIAGSRPVANPGLAGNDAEFAALVARLWPESGDARVGKGRVIVSADPAATLDRLGIAPDFRFTGGQPDSDILFVHRKLADGDSYFLTNRRDRREVVEAHFRVSGRRPEIWYPETGKTRPVSYRIVGGETIVPLTLEPEGAFHVVFRQAAAQDQAVLATPAYRAVGTLDGAWQVSFQPGRGAPAKAVMPQLQSLERNADPAIAHFSGIATYSRDFSTPAKWKPGHDLGLDLGEVHEIAEVSVNGKLAGYAWHTPWVVDIGPYVRRGRNHIEIRVANLWVNRLVGDAGAGAQKYSWTAIPTYRADAPLKPSGLTGPVTLLEKDK